MTIDLKEALRAVCLDGAFTPPFAACGTARGVVIDQHGKSVAMVLPVIQDRRLGAELLAGALNLVAQSNALGAGAGEVAATATELEEAALRAQPARAGVCRRLAQVMRQPGFGG
ncbi:hypothetical protein [Methylobacterium brachiatum]|uniref:hypothetical protein n=1 Tax=Methylobacterium brachiatum TaxID=269660 RepID=UPI0008ECA757|nr:hypothetical protein [Methylobacterium brachiatum]SFJ69042.1 hypothetical protein SAMN02799642_05195 [Methylobacterium brachiatum]